MINELRGKRRHPHFPSRTLRVGIDSELGVRDNHSGESLFGHHRNQERVKGQENMQDHLYGSASTLQDT